MIGAWCQKMRFGRSLVRQHESSAADECLPFESPPQITSVTRKTGARTDWPAPLSYGQPVRAVIHCQQVYRLFAPKGTWVPFTGALFTRPFPNPKVPLDDVIGLLPANGPACGTRVPSSGARFTPPNVCPTRIPVAAPRASGTWVPSRGARLTRPPFPKPLFPPRNKRGTPKPMLLIKPIPLLKKPILLAATIDPPKRPDT